MDPMSDQYNKQQAAGTPPPPGGNLGEDIEVIGFSFKLP